MRFSFPLRRAAAALAASLALAACQDVQCPLSMTPPPEFSLAFSTDTLPDPAAGFRRAEWRSAYLVRYATTDFQSPTDTLRQPWATVGQRPVLAVYASGQHPPQFAVPQSGPAAQPGSYRLVVPAAGRQYDINNIVLTQESGKSRCDGYRITRREATVNGQLRDGLTSPPLLTK
ncbi:hypothetical protein [Hymenobacter ruricola]|uniref:Lipoprotein n=1 Tax=Hymenobacter ruricola TaxID=2791023 RepID=A0ABS0I8E1_9BACT|nr:hypothetical protein [Hymenobacter ruricola]MBF9223174.1 hypothetical protein [Hymenobacter ruricola]